ncbi:hypothetical protein D6789_04080 [Candidatus Woesearchaeota archaeon]|nr:MAG: hypothetical protein D6789_04080 [Candidatus Woesearchaeota archaeon]
MKGQIWTTDFIVGFFLFLFALLLSVSVLVHEAAQHDSFEKVLETTNRLSEQLLSTGYPVDWRDDVITPGLVTDGRFSLRKAERLLELQEKNATAAQQLLGLTTDYLIEVSEKDGTLFPIKDSCFIGTNTTVQQRVTFERLLRVALYSRGLGDLTPTVAGLNGTLYTDEEFGELLDNSSTYDVIILEQPNLGTIAQPYDAEKAERLATFVRRGGTLFLIGNLNLSEAWNLTTLPAPPLNPLGEESNDTLFNLTNLTLINLGADARAINVSGLRRYEPLATFGDGTVFAARFTHGDGDVYYLGSLNAIVNETGETLLQHLSRALIGELSVPSANCTAVTPPRDAARHLAVVHRLLPYKGRALTITVMTWEVRT